MGQCPCPRCYIMLTEVPDLGKDTDSERRMDTRRPTPRLFRMVKKARKAIFEGYKVSGTRIERLIGGWSRVPTIVCMQLPASQQTTDSTHLKNAFMDNIPDLDIYSLLTVDLLHEFELGVWKALLIHIIRILAAHSANSVNELDRRWWPILFAFTIQHSQYQLFQIPSGHPLWTEYHSPLLQQCVSTEEPCCHQL